jgi:hypothetical protein
LGQQQRRLVVVVALQATSLRIVTVVRVVAVRGLLAHHDLAVQVFRVKAITVVMEQRSLRILRLVVAVVQVLSVETGQPQSARVVRVETEVHRALLEQASPMRVAVAVLATQGL